MTVAHIPPSEVELLQELHQARDLPALRARIAALRTAGFTLAGIGVPFRRPLSTIRAWETAHHRAGVPDVAPTGVPVPTPDRPPRAEGRAFRLGRLRPDVPQDDRDRLRRLAAAARTVRRFTAANGSARAAQAELDAALTTYVDRNVAVASLARYCGVTHRAVHARLERAAARRPSEVPGCAAGPGYTAPGLPAVPVPAVGAVRSIDPSTPFVVVRAAGDSPRGALTVHRDGNRVATRPYEQVARSRAADGSAPVLLRPDAAGAAYLDGWLRAPVVGTSLAVPLVLVVHVLGWGTDQFATSTTADVAA